ncbi:uncharacterized protein LOC110033930 [Phalaenopsis equestris]|uniref:uncharacterized protein LOC110033930 n=1 Tax=Phalaenopsis equestris TaxID=78828 RepID=UPI0009E2B6D7|nr:uncharacterized protein LOC110033930 [Phalaenopsis equestris]
MEARSSEGMSLRPRRKPFADITNASSLHSSTATDSVKPKPKLKISPEYSSSKSSVSSSGSTNPKNTGDRESLKCTPVANGSSLISVSGVFSSIKCGFVGNEKGEQSSVRWQYVKEKRKEQKDVSLRASSSCPPLGRSRRVRKNLSMKHEMSQNEAFSEPYRKKKKRQRCSGSAGEDIPLQDFIQKQRAYFAEVDSFELPEEEVSESELE